MDVSFIVPALNEEDYIEATLKSIKAQKTKLKFEIIVSDGMSKDKTATIAKKYAKVIISKTTGIADARNVGAKKAKGKLLVFIDADTTIPEDYLTKVWDRFKSRDDLVALTAKIVSQPENFSTKFFSGATEFMNTLLFMSKGFLVGVNLAVWKDSFEKSGGFPEVPSEDFVFGLNVRKLGKIEYFKGTYSTTSPRRDEKVSVFKLSFYRASIVFTSQLMTSRFSWFRRIGKKLNRTFKYEAVR